MLAAVPVTVTPKVKRTAVIQASVPRMYAAPARLLATRVKLEYWDIVPGRARSNPGKLAWLYVSVMIANVAIKQIATHNVNEFFAQLQPTIRLRIAERTMQCNKTSNRLPYPSPSRVRGHSKYDGQGRNRSEPSRQLREVSSGGPHHAERLVLFLTCILDPCRERAASVVAVFDLAASSDRQSYGLVFAAAHESILHCEAGAEHFRVSDDEPVRHRVSVYS